MSKFNTRFSHLRINTGEDLSLTQKQKANNLLRNDNNNFRLQSPKIIGGHGGNTNNGNLTNRPVQVLYTSPTTTKNENGKNMMNNYLSAGQGNHTQKNNQHSSGYLYTVAGKTEKLDYSNIKGKNNLLSVIKSNLRGKNNNDNNTNNIQQNINTHYSSNAQNRTSNAIGGNPIFKSSSVTKDNKYYTNSNINNEKGNNYIHNNNKLNENYNKFTNKNSLEKAESSNYVANLKKNLTKENIGGYLHSEGNIASGNYNNNNSVKLMRNSSNANKNLTMNNNNHNNNNVLTENNNEMPRILRKDISNNNQGVMATPVHNNQMLMNHNLSAKRDIYANKTDRNMKSLSPNIRLEAPFISDQKKKLAVKNNSKYFSNSLNKQKDNNNDSINYDERVVHTDVSPTTRKSNKPEMIDIMKLISSNQPPISLNVLNKKFDNFENSKYSTKSLKYIKGYSANTHQGTVR